MKHSSFCQAASAAILAAGITAFAVPAHAQTIIVPQLAASAELVTNGGFENAESSAGSNYFAGWTLSGAVNPDPLLPDTFVFGNPHSGDLDAWLGASGSDGFLTQSIATTPGQAYTVSYWLASDSPAISSISAALHPLGDPAVFNDFSASFGGQTLFNQTNLASVPGPPDPSDYTLYSFTAVAASSATPLQFGFRNDASWFHLDDVSITPAAVPEASTTVSLGLLLAFGSLTVIASRRKAH